MAFVCTLCGKGKIRPERPGGVNGRCEHCGQRYWHCQPARPELTEEQWAELKAQLGRKVTESWGQPDGEVS